MYIVKRWACHQTTQTWRQEQWRTPKRCVNTKHNFSVDWLTHSYPYFGRYTQKYSTSISRHLDKIDSDENVVALIHVFAHLLAYHPSVFREKMRRIRPSVANLLNRNKFVKILIKGPHTFYNTPAGPDRLSDYFGAVYKHIMYDEFKGIHDRVTYLNQKDITDAMGEINNHPRESIVAAMVEQMLAYLC